MDFDKLNYFRTVARHGNISRAAEELNLSQSGLSRYLSRLEYEVGAPLFDRRKGKVELNEYGRIFLERVSLAFEQLEEGVEIVRNLYENEKKTICVACAIEDFLVDRLKAYFAMDPEIGIRQVSCSIAEIEENILNRNLVFAICTRPILNEKIGYDQLSTCRWALLCNERNPLAAETSMFLKEARDQTFICETTRLNRVQLTELCKIAGFIPKISHEIENAYIMIDLLEADTGIALVPMAFAAKLDTQYPGNHIRVIDIKDEELPLAEIGIAFLSGKKHAAPVLKFIEFLHSYSDVEAASLKK